ncbi:MAG: BMC domain-containing protein [Clostridia bacterium]|nr:BMC domain-containing protein [Clostridia bacterium]
MTIEEKMRIVQELVPGKQVTLAHLIAHPDPVLYVKMGLTATETETTEAIGILTVTPPEAAVILADVATKASGVTLGFVDRFSGTVIVTGTVSQVEAALERARDYARDKLGCAACELTKT